MTRSERLWMNGAKFSALSMGGIGQIIPAREMQRIPCEYVYTEECRVNGEEVDVDLYVNDDNDIFGVIGSKADFERVVNHTAEV